ncbi:MAG: Rho termination factor N-terminal domain-containing protein [Actinobacteria bacterium]|nr:Rho termination factor N-terminal domain-containing protein [Actinomycetota bacterium]
MAILDRRELEQSPLSDLHTIAAELGIESFRRLRREELIEALLAAEGGQAAEDGKDAAGEDSGDKAAAEDDEPEGAEEVERAEEVEEPPAAGRSGREQPEEAEAEPAAEREIRVGVLDVLPNGSGFMRPDPFAHSRDDVYVSPAQIRRCELRPGDAISGPVRPPRRSERYPSLVHVETVNGEAAEPPPERPLFDDLTPVFASERLAAPEGLEDVPFGNGSRVAVGGPPGSGTTTLLRRIALAIAGSQADIELTVVLAGVRPEEVPEWRRESDLAVVGGGFDRPVEEQTQIAEIAIERAKRVAERGGHAAVVLDSLDALHPASARRLFGAARALEEGGSLTVIASTGLAGEPQRLATTRIVLERTGADGRPELAPASGTLRAERLG